MPHYRTDFHHHCNIDPVDCLDYSPCELVDRLHERGIHAIAITPHGAVFEDPKVIEYAASKGMLLLPAVEKKVDGYEVVLLNVNSCEVPEICSFEDLRELRRKRGDSLFIFAPHPFYPRSSCVGPMLDRYRDLFDAVEFAHLYFSFWNPNRQAVAWAEKNKKPVIANSDSHHLSMAGFHFSIVEAEKLEPLALFNAIRQHKVTRQSRMKTPVELIGFIFNVLCNQQIRRIPRKMGNLISKILRSKERQD